MYLQIRTFRQRSSVEKALLHLISRYAGVDVAKSQTHSCNILLSVVCGYPKSIISSSSSYMMTKLSRIDSSSSSLKYSVNTSTILCRKRRISAALVLRFVRASR